MKKTSSRDTYQLSVEELREILAEKIGKVSTEQVSIGFNRAPGRCGEKDFRVCSLTITVDKEVEHEKSR